MEHFMKMKKKVSSAETTRQVLNKAIDLLHKLSNQKIASDEVKSDLSEVFSQYFLLQNGADKGIEERNKLKLEILLKETYDIVDKLEGGRIPLYESIMLMNKVATGFSHVKVEEEEEKPEKQIQKPKHTVELRPTNQQSKPEEENSSEDSFEEGFDYSGIEREKKIHELTQADNKESEVNKEKISCCSPHELEQCQKCSPKDVNKLMDDVLKHKEMLDQSVGNLNHALQKIGFELKPIEPK